MYLFPDVVWDYATGCPWVVLEDVGTVISHPHLPANIAACTVFGPMRRRFDFTAGSSDLSLD